MTITTGELRHRQRGRAHGPLPPVRGGGGGHFGDEGLQRRPAAGRQDLSLWPGADRIPVHPVCAGQARACSPCCPACGTGRICERVLGFLEASPEERDYSVLGTFTPRDAAGVCVYCNHCQPCPAGLDVGLDQQILRSWPRPGMRWPQDHYAPAGKARGRLHPVRPLRPPRPLPRGPDWADEGDPGLFWPVGRTNRSVLA